MKLALKREWLEYGMLFIVIGVLLWLGPGRIWEHRIDHGYPYALSAQDAFYHQFKTEGIMRIGHYKYEPVSHLFGEYPQFPGYYPPVHSHLAAIWAAFAGLESYQTAPGIVFFSTIVSAVLMYYLVRRFNQSVAILSLPLFPIVFLTQANINAYTWGHWPQVTGLVFLFFFGWLFSQLLIPGWAILLFWALTGSTLTYTGHPIMAGFFFAIFLALYTLKQGFQKKLFSGVGLACCGVILAISRYLIIFKNIWLAHSGYEFSVVTDWPGGGGAVTPANFGFLWWVLLTGAVLAGISLAKMIKQKQWADASVPLLFSLSMLVLGYTNYIGFGKRAFFIRLFWPFFLSLFLGLIVYVIGKLLLQHTGIKWGTLLASGVSLALLLLILAAIPKPLSGRGMMSQEFWGALKWLDGSTPQGSTVVFMYGDEFNGEPLWNSHRHHIRVVPEDFIAALQNLSVKRYYLSYINTDTFPYMIIPTDLHKEGFLNWGWGWNITYDFRLKKERDICAYDYLVFAKNSYQPILAQYNMYIASKLLEKPWITEAFSNDYILILENGQLGETCIEDQKIEQG